MHCHTVLFFVDSIGTLKFAENVISFCIFVVIIKMHRCHIYFMLNLDIVEYIVSQSQIFSLNIFQINIFVESPLQSAGQLKSKTLR